MQNNPNPYQNYTSLAFPQLPQGGPLPPLQSQLDPGLPVKRPRGRPRKVPGTESRVPGIRGRPKGSKTRGGAGKVRGRPRGRGKGAGYGSKRRRGSSDSEGEEDDDGMETESGAEEKDVDSDAEMDTKRDLGEEMPDDVSYLAPRVERCQVSSVKSDSDKFLYFVCSTTPPKTRLEAVNPDLSPSTVERFQNLLLLHLPSELLHHGRSDSSTRTH